MKVKEQLGLVLKASRKLNLVSVEKINTVLEDIASGSHRKYCIYPSGKCQRSEPDGSC